MTVDQLVRIVCRALHDVGITPDHTDACGAWVPTELDLDPSTLTQLFARIDKKLKARGQTAVLGKTMWRKSKSVRDFCEAVAENLE